MASIVVAGGGPLGAATAYHLARRGADVTVASARTSPDAAFLSAGGSICWHRPDPRRRAVIKETADFVRDAVAAGAPIGCRDVPYVFLSEGIQAPALNVNSADLVTHLLVEAERAGARLRDLGRITGVASDGHGGHVLHGEAGDLSADVVVLALGAGNRALLPGLGGRWEKRQLFVTDLPVDDLRADWPHTIARIGSGFAYAFVKDFGDDGLRMVLGQEDLVVDEDLSGPVDHFARLLEAGVAEHFPFLRPARVEHVLWGVDWEAKLPNITTADDGLIGINCGSGVRACIPAGRAAAEAALSAAG